jgi:uncharacterized DUF497 family protein
LKLSGIIWLEEIVEKIERRHRVTQDEVREILRGPSHFRFVERGTGEGRTFTRHWVRRTYLIVFFVRKTTREALIVSARDMTTSERKRYEKS